MQLIIHSCFSEIIILAITYDHHIWLFYQYFLSLYRLGTVSFCYIMRYLCIQFLILLKIDCTQNRAYYKIPITTRWHLTSLATKNYLSSWRPPAAQCMAVWWKSSTTQLPIHFCTMRSIHNKVHFLSQALNISTLWLYLDHEKNIIDFQMRQITDGCLVALYGAIGLGPNWLR